MENLGVHPEDERVSFGQIYGMGEQLSIPLGIKCHLRSCSISILGIFDQLFNLKKNIVNFISFHGTSKHQQDIMFTSQFHLDQ